MLLGPERVIEAEGPAHEILKRCDGTRTIGEIVDELAALYTADRAEIAADVNDMLAELVDQADAGVSARDAGIPAPLGLLAELTHRCPLACPYCSNPLTLGQSGGRTGRRDLGARLSRGGRRWACCRCICPAANRHRAATWSRSSPRRATPGSTPT